LLSNPGGHLEFILHSGTYGAIKSHRRAAKRAFPDRHYPSSPDPHPYYSAPVLLRIHHYSAFIGGQPFSLPFPHPPKTRSQHFQVYFWPFFGPF
jgi:hypothetical protein